MTHPEEVTRLAELLHEAINALPYRGGGHLDTWWSDAVGQQQTWHECVAGGLSHEEVNAVVDRVLAGVRVQPEPQAGDLDVERLMIAVFNADQPGDWPTWADYIAAFGSAGTPPWRRKAEAIAREYAALQPITPPAIDHTEDERGG